MRRAHLDRFRPRCPLCVAMGRGTQSLALGHVEREDAAGVVEGALVCSEPRCRFEFPILGGLPFITTDVRGTIATYADELRARDDLSPWMESVLADCVGPDATWNVLRDHVGSYGQGHWGDHEPGGSIPRESTVLGVVDAALALAGAPTGAWIDLGCSLGRASFELAARGADLVLGVDLHVAKLLAARRILTSGRLRYGRRKVGVIYERVDLALDLPQADKVDFWVCDATALPFPDGALDGALSIHVLDSIKSPLSHLIETGRVLAPGAPAVFASPYDWSTGATSFEGWIGGHSQRAPHRGDSASELRRLLSADDAARLGSGLAITAERDNVRWPVRVHDRATMEYRVHVACARKRT
ncbi:MAG TPA: methyltransferase domain-containing protein [Kofleriaceae bacterium]|nr:methyltransferase domain-containing protein [Kofleriaceae bacterium]